MSKDINKDRQRPSSAKSLGNYAQKLNQPYSNQRLIYEREESIKNIYARSKSTKISGLQSNCKSGEGLNDTEKVRKIIKKPKQQMAEEIVNLKLKINELTQDLNHQRGKTEEIRKKYNKFARVLNIEFQNQRIWNAGVINMHKVEGIRSMYDRLKEQYEKMRAHYLDLLKSSKTTREMQYLQYIEALQTEIKGLYQKFKKIEDNIANLLKNTNKNEQVTFRSYLLGQNEHQFNRLEEKYTKIKAKLVMKNQIIEDRQKKIVLLDKYCKQLENKLRQESKYEKKVQKQLMQLQNKYQILVEQNQREKCNNQRQIRGLQTKIEFQNEEFEKQNQKLVRQKDEKIAEILQKNNYYQNTINQLRKSNNSMAYDYQKLKNSSNGNFKVNKQSEITLKERFALLTPDDLKTEEKKRPSSRTQSKKSQYCSQKQVRQTADKPQKNNAVKRRRIQHQQIIEISNLMKYKVIGKGVTVNQIKELFVYKSVDSTEKLWKQQSISMAEMKNILISEPFTLSEEEAQLMARYLIEDVKEQYVYVDQNNQNYREVVKSIVKTLLGQYPVLQNNENLKAQLKRFYNQYANKVEKILKGVSVDGTITKRKLLEIMKGAGAEFSEELIDILIGKMAQNAQNLNSLVYDEIFTIEQI